MITILADRADNFLMLRFWDHVCRNVISLSATSSASVQGFVSIVVACTSQDVSVDMRLRDTVWLRPGHAHL